MRVRLSTYAQNLRQAPIDGLDAFLMSRVVDTVDVSELVDTVPCSADEAQRRIKRLAALGLLEVVTTTAAVSGERSGSLRTVAHRDDDEATLRPPAPRPRGNTDGEPFGAVDTGVRLRPSAVPLAWVRLSAVKR